MWLEDAARRWGRSAATYESPTVDEISFTDRDGPGEKSRDWLDRSSLGSVFLCVTELGESGLRELEENEDSRYGHRPFRQTRG